MTDSVRVSTGAGYSIGEEIGNAVSHGIGALLAVAGLVVMVVYAALYGTAWHVVSTAIYGATLVLLYLASTLYHGLTHARAKRIFKILDHAGVYLLIAGTYTPFTLVTLRGAWGWSLFGTVWGLALLGIVFEAFWVYRPKWASVVVYVAMGWIIVIAARPLFASLPAPALWLLFAGGLSYTGGTAFYVLKRVRYMHMVWHLWVLGGSICHFLAVIFYVIPDPT
jgi:hemolysin III